MKSSKLTCSGGLLHVLSRDASVYPAGYYTFERSSEAGTDPGKTNVELAAAPLRLELAATYGTAYAKDAFRARLVEAQNSSN